MNKNEVAGALIDAGFVDIRINPAGKVQVKITPAGKQAMKLLDKLIKKEVT